MSINRIDWAWLRKELGVILLYGITFTIMTYPLVFKLGEIIPMKNPDTYTAMWQNWWLQQVFTNSQDPNFTDLLFYPNGLDLTLMPRRWTSYPIWVTFFSLFGEPLAYNLTVVTQTLIKAYAMYRLILLFVPHRPSAWVGGAFFSFAPRILVASLQQPNTGSVEFLPIFMIFFVLALRRIHDDPHHIKSIAGLMLVASLAFTANVYMNLKIGVFAVLIGGFYLAGIFVIHQLWQYRSFWLSISLFVLVSSILCAPNYPAYVNL